MRNTIGRVLSAVAPVLGVVFSIEVLQAAGGLFPLALAWEAWPAWVIFAALVHTLTNLLWYGAGRIGGAPAAPGDAARPA